MKRSPALQGADRLELPPEQTRALRHAVRLEWLTIGFLASAVTVMYLAMGSSQAMRAAWVEDMLSFLPPLAFLVGNRLRSRPSDRKHPFGFHRSVSVGYLVAALALLVMGSLLVLESGIGLLRGERTAIGLVTVAGHTFWAGWLMVAALTYTLVPPVLLGRAKHRPAAVLHDKVLHADAAMNRADWATAAAGIVGVLGIGLGLWWLDGVAAVVIGSSVARDGWGNLRAALSDLMDSEPSPFDRPGSEHPVVARIGQHLGTVPWVAQGQVRAREEGHIFHVEVFVVPKGGEPVDVAALDALREELHALDWKLHDVVVVPVARLPVGHLPADPAAPARGRR